MNSKDDFGLDLEAIETAITANTKAILINSPNNPSGVVYSEDDLKKLSEIIKKKEEEYKHDIILISDEPYVGLVYDGVTVPPVLQIFPHSILASSFSKDLALAGERIGYLAINPSNNNSGEIFDGAVFNNRILGFVNAPALMQRLVDTVLRKIEIDGLQKIETAGLQEYQARRDLLYDELTGMGYQIVKPQGTFYMFPKSPIDNDFEFVQRALRDNLLLVPGRAFGRPGYFRISYSEISLEQINRSLSVFQSLAEFYGLTK